MSDYQAVTAILANIICVFALYKLLQIFFTTERSHKQELALYIVAYVILTVVYVGWNTPEITMMSNILVIFGLSCFYSSNWMRRLTATAFVFSIAFLCEMIVVEVVEALGFSRYDDYSDGEFVFVQIAIQMLSYCTAIWLSQRKNLRDEQTVPSNYSRAIFAVPVCSIYPTYILMKVTELPDWQVAVGVVTLFFINALIFYLYDWILGMYREKLTLTAVAEQNKMYKRQLAIEQEAGRKMSRLRHDWNNALLPILGQLEAGQSQAARDALRGLLAEVRATKPIVTGIDPALAAVINYKLADARDKGVAITCETHLPPDLGKQIDIQDIAILLGNLLDNAIRAVEDYRQEAPYIKLALTVNRGVLRIIVANSFDGPVLYQNGKYLSTKADKANHGLGLQTVHRIADKYQGDVQPTHQGHDFMVDVLLYLTA